MKTLLYRLSTAAVIAVVWVHALAATEPPHGGIHEFLRKHCAECHGDGGAKGGFSIELLDSKARRIAGSGDFRTYEKIFNQLSKNKMPPREAEQPTSDERQAAVAALQAYLDTVIDDRGSRYAGAFARRLNREQLQNDLFDTLGIDRTLYGLPPFVESLPEEGRTDGFDTVGYGLGQSSLLLGQYQQFVDHYLVLATDNYPAPQRWRFKFGGRYLADDQQSSTAWGIESSLTSTIVKRVSRIAPCRHLI